jgi:hypothetical protein
MQIRENSQQGPGIRGRNLSRACRIKNQAVQEAKQRMQTRVKNQEGQEVRNVRQPDKARRAGTYEGQTGQDLESGRAGN